MMVAVFTPAILAEEFIVGDETGWTVGFDYQAWAVGKNFQIGDKLGNGFVNYIDLLFVLLFVLF